MLELRFFLEHHVGPLVIFLKHILETCPFFVGIVNKLVERGIVVNVIENAGVGVKIVIVFSQITTFLTSLTSNPHH